MNPLIITKPTRDGGRRMLTEEAKATVAAWLRMIQQRLVRQADGIERVGGKPLHRGDGAKLSVLVIKIDQLWDILGKIDEAFDREEFMAAFKWATELMYGKPDDPGGGGKDGDAISPGAG